MLSHFGHVWLFATIWTVACQGRLSMGLFQARVLDWVSISYSREYSLHRDQNRLSFISPALAGGFFTTNVTWEALQDRHILFKLKKKKQPFLMTHNTSLKQDWSVFKNKQINHRQQSNDLNLVMNATSIFSEPGGSSGEESTCQCRRCKRLGFDLYCYLGVGSGNPLQSSCWENSMDRGAWGLQSIGSQKIGHHQVNEHMYVFWHSLDFCCHDNWSEYISLALC